MGWMIEAIDVETDRATHQVHVIRRNRKFWALTHDKRPNLLLESTSFLECVRVVRSPRSAVA
mgnify:FL=1